MSQTYKLEEAFINELSLIFDDLNVVNIAINKWKLNPILIAQNKSYWYQNR